MTKTDDKIIEEVLEESIKYIRHTCKWIDFGDLKALEHKLFRDHKKALSLKQKQQDELLNKFNKKVDEEIKSRKEDYGKPLDEVDRVRDASLIEGLEKSKQLAKEVFTKNG